jgi:KDO2-lipid IV(A) lauroyltransferase
MEKLKYLIQFILISFLFIIFKIIGISFSRYLASIIFIHLGPIFRSKKIVNENISKVFPNKDNFFKKKIVKNMWSYYGKILAEYVFIKRIRSSNTNSFLRLEGQEILDKIKSSNEPVIFISGHFDNFELMAMQIEKSGIDLAAIYRPLNNQFLNPLMENIRKKYICKKQIKKGISGTKEILKYFKNGTSIALMIDQRVSEGERVNFFGKGALTTTIPAQFVKKFKCKIVPVNIKREENNKFKCRIFEPVKFQEDENLKTITEHLNRIIENMILENPSQWIWTHNRWK